MITLIVAVLLLSTAGAFDLKKREVPDLLTSFLWLLALVVSINDNYLLVTLGLVFALLYFFNSISAFFKKEILGWADVLLIPVYLVFCCSIDKGLFYPALSFVAMGLLVSSITRKGQPLAVYMACGFNFIVGYCVLGPILF